MKRRNFLKALGAGAAISSLPMSSRVWAANSADYQGEFYLMIQASGAWDVTNFCDPKMNQTGENIITQWSQNKETLTAGNLRYAPMANNATLFEKYYDRSLVINGIAMGTNAHSAGRSHMFTGRMNDGYPTLTALAAAKHGSGLSMPYVSQGGLSPARGTTTVTRLNSRSAVMQGTSPQLTYYLNDTTFFADSDYSDLMQAHHARNQRLQAVDNLLPQHQLNRDLFAQQRLAAEQLSVYTDTVRSLGNTDVGIDTINADALNMILMAFKSGVACSGDISFGGFDTHDNNDANFSDAITEVNLAVDYIWTMAEVLGIDQRLNVIMVSDFARTPYYNSRNGKDHWPAGSAIFMKKGVNWTNRVVGQTDGGQFSRKLNTQTLQVDDANGVALQPKDVHLAARKLFGLHNQAPATDFFLVEDVSFDLFNGNLSTGWGS